MARCAPPRVAAAAAAAPDAAAAPPAAAAPAAAEKRLEMRPAMTRALGDAMAADGRVIYMGEVTLTLTFVTSP